MQTISNFKEIEIAADSVKLKGNLAIIENAKGIVLFSHGSGSSRFSPRNNFVAQYLQKRGFATLLFDLLTSEEDKVYDNRFDIDLLTERLVEVTKWIQKFPQTKALKIGYFGASTGAASALKAAAVIGSSIKAVVSRGGRPDMAVGALEKVKSPTLLIVGDKDKPVIQLNDNAYQKLACIKRMELVIDATHLFPEEGKLEEVAVLAGDWFEKYVK